MCRVNMLGIRAKLAVDEQASQVKMDYYDELIRSLPKNERNHIITELNSRKVIRRAELLETELTTDKHVRPNLNESRVLFLAALRNLKLGKITIGQLATMHLLDSAIRTLYKNPFTYLIYRYTQDNKLKRTIIVNSNEQSLRGMPDTVWWHRYNVIAKPDSAAAVSDDWPHRMKKPLIWRYFNFTDAEWIRFCEEMDKAPLSEQLFNVLIAPVEGCYSSMIAQIQRILICMQTLDRYVDSENGLELETIMLVPSFTMFQAALNSKAYTYKRASVELIPTYGLICAEHYSELKAGGKIAFSIYMPEVKSALRYKSNIGGFRTTIDGHDSETAFAAAIHDVYHAMRELAMAENVAKARMRMASIAKNHPNNKLTPTSREVDDLLIDGELIFSYPPSLDTMFNPDYRPRAAEPFGNIFYTTFLKGALHENLKHAFIEDMVVNEGLWQTQFNLGRADLRKIDQDIFDDIKSRNSNKTRTVVPFSNARAIGTMGLLARNSAVASDASSTDPSLLVDSHSTF